MTNTTNIKEVPKEVWERNRQNGGGGGGSDMTDARLTKLELALEHTAKDADLRELKAKVESTLPHLATKADLSSLESSLIKWFVGTSFAAVGVAAAIAFGVARLL